MKVLVYETKTDSRTALYRCIFAALEHTQNHPNTITSTTYSLLMRAEKFIATRRGHFKRLPWNVYYNTGKQYTKIIIQLYMSEQRSQTAHSPSKHKDKHGFIISQCKHTEQ